MGRGRKPIAMVGKRFGKWTVISESKKRTWNNRICYLCKCDCGSMRIIEGTTLRYGASKSCGCNGTHLYLYTVYRNSDDKLMAFDVTAKEAAKVMGMKQSSLYHLFSVHGGITRKWTVYKSDRKESEGDCN